MTMLVSEPPARSADEVVIRFVDPTNDPAWNTRLSKVPGFAFFHNSAWTSVLKETYGFQGCYVFAEQEGKPCGLLPLMEVDNWPKGRRGVSLPFTDECPVLGTESRFQQQVIEATMQEGKRRDWKYVEYRGIPSLFPSAQPSLSFYGHHLELYSSEKEMFDRLDSAVQRAIRKATKSGIIVEVTTTLEAVRTFFRLHGQTRRKHGIPPQSFTFFESIHRNILECGLGFVVIAKLAGKPIAAAFFFHHGTKAIFKYGASDERFQHLRANNLVMWEAIRWLAGHGFVELDFGRTSMGNEGLRRFKLSWGTSEGRIDYWKYGFGSGRFVKDRDQASGWHTRIFNLLPSPISGWVGALLYPRLA